MPKGIHNNSIEVDNQEQHLEYIEGKKRYKRKYSKHFRANYSAEFLNRTADELLEWFEADNKNIFIKDFSSSRKMTGGLLRNFCNRSDYFKNVYELVKDYSEVRLCKMAIEGKANASNIFLLKNVAGFRDNPENPNDLNENELDVLRGIIKEHTEKNI